MSQVKIKASWRAFLTNILKVEVGSRYKVIFSARIHLFLNASVRKACISPPPSFIDVLKSFFMFSFLPMVSPASFASNQWAQVARANVALNKIFFFCALKHEYVGQQLFL